MSALVGNSLFWYGLALKIAMTASIVVAASVVVERSGPFVGSLVAALPTARGRHDHPMAIFAARRFRIEGPIKRVELNGADLAWHAGLVTFCVIIVTTASSSIGSYFSGVFAFFPVAMGSFFIILHTRIGGLAAASVAAHVLPPLIGLGLGLLAVHFPAVPLGSWWSYAVGLSIGLTWNALLWLVRDWRAARSVRPPESGDRGPISKR
jgi:hypothetical protein